MKTRPRTMSAVCELLNVDRRQVEYAITCGYVPIPRRPRKWHYFSDTEIKSLAKHFGLTVPEEVERVGE